jgi:2-(3-amino-3-carboxypropyl)histidine synthase
MNDYDFELERIIKEAKKARAKTIGLQLPEGLKQHATDIAERIEKEAKAQTIILTDPTYGACDTKKQQAEKLGIDLLVHFGHTQMKRKTSR